MLLKVMRRSNFSAMFPVKNKVNFFVSMKILQQSSCRENNSQMVGNHQLRYYKLNRNHSTSMQNYGEYKPRLLYCSSGYRDRRNI